MAQRTALLIDGANLFAATKMLGFHMDWTKLYNYFLQTNDIVRRNYYTAIRETRNTDTQDPIIPLIDHLAFNGWKVVTKPVMEYHNREGSTLKGNMDVHMVVDALTMADRIDHYILGSGDGDFVYLVDALHRLGLEVSVLSTKETNPPMVATALRREADTFYELAELRNLIRREERK